MIGFAAQSLLLLFAILVPGPDFPPGFSNIFGGVDLKGWHISEVSHDGNSRGWTVDNGVHRATQDGPGNGGILLTDPSSGTSRYTLRSTRTGRES